VVLQDKMFKITPISVYTIELKDAELEINPLKVYTRMIKLRMLSGRLTSADALLLVLS